MKKMYSDMISIALVIVVLISFDGVVSWIIALSILPVKWLIDWMYQNYKRDSDSNHCERPDAMIVKVSKSKISHSNIGMFRLDNVSFISKKTGLILGIIDINIPIYSTAFISASKWMTGNRGCTTNYVDLINRVLFDKPYDSGFINSIKYYGAVDTIIDIDSRLKKNKDVIVDTLKDLLPVGNVTVIYTDEE